MSRILVVIETAGRGGGAEQALINLLPELKRAGHWCGLAALCPPYEHARTFEALGVPTYRLDLKHPALHPDEKALPYRTLAEGVPRLSSLVRELDPDIIHSHLFYAGVTTALIPKAVSRAPRVITFHNLDYELHAAKSPVRRLWKRAHGQLMRRRMQGWSAVTQSVADHYRDHLGLESVAVIPNAIDLSPLTPKPELDRRAVLARFGVEREGPVIAAAGRMVRQKGGRYLIEAVASLRARGRTPTVVMVGHGHLRDDYQKMVDDAGMHEQFALHPAVTHAELMELFQAADIVALPSLYEGFGVVAAEAMALERAFVGTRIGALMEFVDDERSGLLVPPSDAARLADAFARLIDDPELRARLGKTARQTVIERFSAPVVARAWLDYYARLA